MFELLNNNLSTSSLFLLISALTFLNGILVITFSVIYLLKFEIGKVGPLEISLRTKLLLPAANPTLRPETL